MLTGRVVPVQTVAYRTRRVNETNPTMNRHATGARWAAAAAVFSLLILGALAGGAALADGAAGCGLPIRE